MGKRRHSGVNTSEEAESYEDVVARRTRSLLIEDMGMLEGKTALVTGGSRGIGRAICLQLASQGAEIVLHYNRNRAAAEEVAAAIGREVEVKETEAKAVKLVHANMASPLEIQAMFRDLGDLKLDFLINNAGVWKSTPVCTSAAEVIDEVVDTNLKGPFWVTQCALALLNDGGRIINISSVAARTGVAGGRSLYGATKAGVDSLTKNWALELAPRKILVNSVAPGYVPTDMTADYLSDAATFERAIKRHPLGRLCTPEDVADVVTFLCSDGAKFITGQSINVSGGFVI